MKPAPYPTATRNRVAAAATGGPTRDFPALRRNETCNRDRTNGVGDLINLLSTSGCGEAWAFLLPRLNVAAQPERRIEFRSSDGWVVPPTEPDEDTPPDVRSAAQLAGRLNQIADGFRNQGTQDPGSLLVAARFILDVAGEVFVWRRENGTYGVAGPWAVGVRGNTLTVNTRRSNSVSTSLTNTPDSTVWARWHIPDLVWPDEGRSWLLPGLESLQRIRDLRLGVLRAPLSRQGRTGVTWYPADADQWIEPGAPSIRDMLVEYSAASITDPGSMAAFAAPVVSWAAEYGPPIHVDTTTQLNPAELDALQAEIENFARLVPAPTGSIVNTGDQPYANALVQSQEAVTLYANPALGELAELHTTVQFRPALAAIRVDPDRWRIRYTADHLAPRSTAGALDQSRIHSMLPRTRVSVASELGVEEGDLIPLPDGVSEWDWWIMTTAGGSAGEQPGEGGGTPNGVTVAGALNPPQPDHPEPGVTVRAATRDVTDAEKWVLTAVTRDSELVARLQGLGDAAVAEAVKKAGSRLVSRKAGLPAATQQTLRATTDPYSVAAAVTVVERVAAGADDDTLLADTMTVLETQTRDLLTVEAEAADRHANPDGWDTPANTKKREAAVDRAVTLFVTAALLSAKRVINREPVNTPLPGATPTSKVGVVGWAARDAVAAAGGWLVRKFDDTRFGKVFRAVRDWPEHGIPGLWAGPRNTETVVKSRDVTLNYRWEHGGATNPFPPHQALDGATWVTAGERDGITMVDPTTTWPGTSYFPGDHDGCTCRITIGVAQ